MRRWLVIIGVCAWATVASAQVGEFSLSFGQSRFGDPTLGTIAADARAAATNLSRITLTDGFRLTLRFTLNTYRFFGHEFGYAYSRSQLRVQSQPPQDLSTPVHQGFYNFLAYATPEGSHIRPFATGGIHFSSFFPPGTSAYYGNQITKFGFNYGGGLKFRITPIIGARIDLRQYNTGQPFDFPGQKGRLKQTEISAGLAFIF